MPHEYAALRALQSRHQRARHGRACNRPVFCEAADEERRQRLRDRDREALAGELGLAASGGTFSTYLSRLVSNGLATRLPEGVRAAGELFPAGSEAR